MRDVAAFALGCAESKLAGIWNVTSDAIPFLKVLDVTRAVSDFKAELVWIEEEKINKVGAKPWVDIPMMAPAHCAY